MDRNPIEIALAIIISLTFFQFFGFLSRRFNKLPPGPFPLPIIGNLLSLGDQQHKSLANLSKKYGPIMTLKLGQVTTVVISSPTLAREILQKQDLAFANRYVPNALHAMDHYKYSVAWMSICPRFRSLRKIMNTNMFSSSSLDASQHLRLSKIQELVAYCSRYSQSGEALHIGLAVSRTTLNLLSNTLFSKNLTDPFSVSIKDQEFKDLVSNIFEEIGKRNLVDFFPVFERFDPNGIKRRMTTHLEQLFKLFGEMIDERLEQRKSSDGTRYNDMLEILLDMSEEINPEDIDKKHSEHLFLDLFVAATDTTTITIEWAMSEILKNPIIMKRIQVELAQVIGKGKPLEEVDVTRLPYLSCVVKETFRLHPAGPILLPRKVEHDVEVHGYIVPKGSKVLVNNWAIARDSNVWEDSLVFKPERFWQSELDVRGQDFELIPFGSGRRLCPGLPLAYRIIPAMLGSLLNSFDWKLENDIDPEQLNMEEKYGTTLQRVRPLLVVPISLCTSQRDKDDTC